MKPLSWYWLFLKKYKIRVLIGLIMTLIVCFLNFVNPYLSGIIVDDVIKGGKLELLTKIVIILVGCTLFRTIIRYISLVFCFEETSQNVLYDMRENVYRALQRQDFEFFDHNRTGDLMSRMTGDMDAIRHFTSYLIYAVFENVILFFLALIMMFTINWKLALLMSLITPFTAFFTYRQSKEIKPIFYETRNQFSRLNTVVQENISGNRVVKAFTREDYEIEKFNIENDAYKDINISSTEIGAKFIPILDFFAGFLPVVLLLAGGIMVINDTITLGEFVTFSGYLWMLNNPLRMAGWFVNDIQRFTTSVEKIYTAIKIKPRIKNPTKKTDKKEIKGNVEFKKVYFKYDDNNILADINFVAKAGQTIAIVGPTGSGKSTLVNLICRFYDVSSGEVKVDGINVKKLDLYQLRKYIGMAMQDVFLFSNTVEGNIAYSDVNASFDKVEWAAKIANADGFIGNMPQKYDTIVGERGVGLSGGQKQRIALARALLKEPSIMILDDTTSAVDMETESSIQAELKSVSKKCTTFIIAHRISSVKNADLILVLNNGKIIERGTHNELVHKKGYYYEVFQNQYGNFNDIENEVK